MVEVGPVALMQADHVEEHDVRFVAERPLVGDEDVAVPTDQHARDPSRDHGFALVTT